MNYNVIIYLLLSSFAMNTPSQAESQNIIQASQAVKALDLAAVVESVHAFSQQGLSVQDAVNQLEHGSGEQVNEEDSAWKWMALIVGAAALGAGGLLWYAWWRSNNNFVYNGQVIHSPDELMA